MATGDQALVREASAFLPGIETVQVKTSLDCRTTDCYPLLEARRQIENAAERALSRISKFKPVHVTKPIKTDVSLPEESTFRPVRHDSPSQENRKEDNPIRCRKLGRGKQVYTDDYPFSWPVLDWSPFGYVEQA